jgi:hypothetical protein
MAAEYLFSKDVAVFVDMSATETPDWKLVTCTTSKTVDLAIGSIEKNNDCTGNYVGNLPSTISWSFAIEGDANMNPTDPEEISYAELFIIAKNREIRNWKLEKADNSYVRYGRAFLSSYSESISTPEYMTFSASLTGDGEIYDSIPS